MIARSSAVRRGFGVAVAAVLITSGCAAGRDAQTQNQVPTQDGTNADVGTMALRGVSLEAPSSAAYYRPGSAIPMRLVLVNNGTSNDTLENIVTSAARGWASYRNAALARAGTREQTTRKTPGTSGPSASTTPGTSPSTSPSTSPGGTSSSPTGTATGTRTGGGSSSVSGSASATTSTSSVPQGVTSVVIPTGQRVSWGVPDSSKVLVLVSSVGRIYPGTTVRITFTFAKAGSVTLPVPVQLSSQPGDVTISPDGDSGD